MTSVVLVHGSFLGPWIWQPLVRRLRAKGVSVDTVSLPSCGIRPGRAVSLSDDVAVVAAAIARGAAPVVLCGHSYGGIPITAAGLPDSVARLVYLCAYMPGQDESLNTLAHGHPLSWVRRDPNGLAVPDQARGAAAMLGAASSEFTRFVARRLRPQAVGVFADCPVRVAWKEKPSTFVLTDCDRVLPTGRQRHMAARASCRVVVSAGHLPQLTCPGVIAKVLLQAG